MHDDFPAFGDPQNSMTIGLRGITDFFSFIICSASPSSSLIFFERSSSLTDMLKPPEISKLLQTDRFQMLNDRACYRGAVS
jgi:hypothetical protein